MWKKHQRAKDKLDEYYGNYAPSILKVQGWFTEFRCGRTNISDTEHSGRLIGVTSFETIEKFQNMVLVGRKLKKREVADAGLAVFHNRIRHNTLKIKQQSKL